MSKKPRGLGSGFAALISQSSTMTVSASVAQQDQSLEKKEHLINIPIDHLTSGRFQPRTQWDEDRLKELSESIQSQGIVQPIVVRFIAPQHYEIIAGERRWRAAKLAGLVEVPVLVKQMDDQSAMAIALIENIQREDLSAIEEARAIKKLIDAFVLTHEQIAKILGRSRESISNLLRLLKLDISVQESVLDGFLSAGHARSLLPLNEHDQKLLAQQAMSLQWSVRDIEQAVKAKLSQKDDIKHRIPSSLPVDVQILQDKVSEKLGASVKLKLSASGKGKIEISFNDQEELQRVMSFF